MLAMGPGVALPVHAAAVNKGAQHGTLGRVPGYLGIEFHDVSEDQASALHLKGVRAVVVAMVDHDAPAGKAGVLINDVIVTMNGQPVTGMDSLHRMIHDAGAGATVEVGILRKGAPVKLEIQLADQKEVERQALKMALPDPPPSDPSSPILPGFTETFTAPPSTAVTHQSFISAMLHMTPFTGLAMEEMEPQLAAYFSTPGGTGLLVHTVLPNSPAAEAGLQAGDIVIKADAVVLKSTGDWTRHLHAVKGKPVVLTVWREKQQQQFQVTVQPDLKRHSEVLWPHLLGGND